MSEIGVRSGKVRPGFYRCSRLCIHKGRKWGVYDGPTLLKEFRTLTDAYNWSRRFLNGATL